MARTSKLTAVAVAAFGAFGALCVLRRAGLPVAPGLPTASAAVALLLAVAAASRALSSAWRGPVLVHFPREAGIECNAAESAKVRAAAQLRGTLGGAGHVHPRRLAFPTLAWIAAAAMAGWAIEGYALAPGWPASLLVLALVALAAFPPVPFWYREANGGVVLLYPRSAFVEIASRARSVGEPQASAPSESPPGWGTSPNEADAGGKPADLRASRQTNGLSPEV